MDTNCPDDLIDQFSCKTTMVDLGIERGRACRGRKGVS